MATPDNESSSDDTYGKNFDPIARAKALSNAEQSGANNPTTSYNTDTEDSSRQDPLDPTEAAREQEASPSPEYENNYTGEQSPKRNWRVVFKKGGAPMLIIGILIGIAGIVSFFGGSGLAIVHFTETLSDKFNYQQASGSVRTRKILQAKVDNSTTGACGKVITIRCKFASFSDTEIENFRKAGITIEIDGDMRKSFGRTRIKSMSFDNKTIDPTKFVSEMSTNTKFAVAVRTGFNPKYAAFSPADTAWSAIKRRLRISGLAPFTPDMTDEERRQTVIDKTKNGDIDLTRATTDDPDCDASCQSQRNTANSAIDDIQDLADDAGDGTKSSTAVLNAIQSGTSISSLLNAFKITGIADDVCMGIGMYKAVGIGAKTVRLVQMAGFAMIIFKVSDMIKSQDATAGDVAFIGSMLTSIYTMNNGLKTKSATDSFGYRYAAYGDKGIDDNASQYLAGGGLGGTMRGTLNALYSALPGGREAVDATCKTLNNLAVQAASLALGVALWLIPGGQAISASKLAGQAVLGATMFAVQAYLPALLADIIAGRLFDKSTTSESVGNIAVAGIGGALSLVAIAGGNPISTRRQAKSIAYAMEAERKQYALLDQAEFSPFDVTNSNTFLGSIYSSFMPSIMQIQSGGPSGSVAAMGNIVGSTFSNLLPKVGAAETEEYNECEDPDYVRLGIATDPFCNMVPGMEPSLLQESPVAVTDRLTAQNLIDPVSGQPTGEYVDFTKNCIAREIPFGMSSDDSTISDGSECLLADTSTANLNSELSAADLVKRDMYVYAMDNRMLNVMESGYDAPAATPEAAAPAVTTPTIVDTPNKNGWSVPIQNGGRISLRWHVWASKGLHKGIDFPAIRGTPVTAAHDGRVTKVTNMGSCGYATVIEATGVSGIYHAYQHMNPSVKVGDTVTRGQVIGYVGTFCGTGTHLHFSIETANRVSPYKGEDTSKDPEDYLPL